MAIDLYEEAAFDLCLLLERERRGEDVTEAREAILNEWDEDEATGLLGAAYDIANERSHESVYDDATGQDEEVWND